MRLIQRDAVSLQPACSRRLRAARRSRSISRDRNHAGENLGELLKQRRAELEPPLQMCDALSRNAPEDLPTIVANSLSHARRNFVDVAEALPDQVAHVLQRLQQVYHVDAVARRFGASPQLRWQLHRRLSGPVMAELHRWLEHQLSAHQAEPKSSLGKAIRYMLKHWEKLTRFLEVSGVPLDNNVVERALKLAIRYRKNSLFYRTQRGAQVGDVYLSLIQTCRQSDVDPLAYLNRLQRNADRVKQSPSQ